MSDKIFTLEVLNAFHGDCLLLHYGTLDKPKIMLVDGGPNGTFDASLKPRILTLSETRSKPLKLDHVMVSHLDDDHISGILQLVEEIKSGTELCKAPSFWFNTFDDTMQLAPPALAEARDDLGLTEAAAITASVEHASVNQGRDLRDAVATIFSKQNNGEDLLFSDGQGRPLAISGLDVTLVCPDKQHLADLAEKWIASPKKKADTAAYVDKSVFNLSSLVVVVSPKDEEDGPRILLTGDARGDHILAGLGGAGLLDDDGTAHFSILKVPHHGSDRNLDREFFRKITADYYVLSGDGKYSNPSASVLAWIAQAASNDAKICLTYDNNPQYDGYGPSVQKVLAKYPHLAAQLLVRGPEELLLRIDLMAPLAD